MLDRRAMRLASSGVKCGTVLGEIEMKHLWNTSIGALLGLGLALVPLTLHAAEGGKLAIELNKFEEDENGGCRAFFLFRNQTELTFEGFEMSLAILNSQGIIDRLLSIDAAPISAARTTLKLFEIPGIACDDISEVLLHELASCKPQNAEQTDCFPLLELISRTPAKLVK